MVTSGGLTDLLPIRPNPAPAESLNSIVWRTADANCIPAAWITGARSKYVMKPTASIVNAIATRTGISSRVLWRHTAPTFVHRIGFRPMCLNTRRLQYCRQCSDEPELRDWYFPTTFACTRCHVLLTDGDSAQLSVSDRALGIQRHMAAFATRRTARTSHVYGHFDDMYRNMMRCRMSRLSDPESIALASQSELNGRDRENHGTIPVHPPSTAVAALELWKRSLAKRNYRYARYVSSQSR